MPGNYEYPPLIEAQSYDEYVREYKNENSFKCKILLCDPFSKEEWAQERAKKLHKKLKLDGSKYKESSDVEFLERMFATDEIMTTNHSTDPEASVKNVMDILSNNLSGLPFDSELPLTDYGFAMSDSGFKGEYQDQWKSSRNQVGHFMTAVMMSMDSSWGPIGKFTKIAGADLVPDNEPVEKTILKLIIGHELEPDGTGGSGKNNPYNAREQYKAMNGKKGDAYIKTFNDALSILGPNGTNISAARKHLKDNIKITDTQEGNSYEDLQLALMGYYLGQEIKKKPSKFKSSSDVAKWIHENIREENPKDLWGE